MDAKTEVDELCLCEFLVDQNVFELDVAVGDLKGVQVLEGRGDLAEEPQRELFAQTLLVLEFYDFWRLGDFKNNFEKTFFCCEYFKENEIFKILNNHSY